MEPRWRGRRLSGMRRASVVVVAALVLFGTAPAAAQEQGVTLEASAGLGGYVNPSRPVALAVDISAQVLFVGTLEARMRDSILRIPVEVPAGSRKTYPITAPPPLAGSSIRLRLFPDGSDQAVANTSVAMRVPGNDEVLVGVIGDPSLEKVLKTVRTVPGEIPVTPLILGVGVLSDDLAPLGYLVLGHAGPATPALASWVQSGGRLVVAFDQLSALDLPAGSFATLDGTEIAVARLDEGEVIGVPSLGSLDASEWGRVLRPLPIGGTRREVWQSPEPSLMTAATAGGDTGVPSLPWLLGALIAFAVLVGPVNFVVLGRLRRKELAWVTIPIISGLALGAFWLAGRTRLQSVVANHASLVVATDTGALGRSAVAVVAGAAGRQELAVPDGWLMYPYQVVGFFGGPGPFMEGGGNLPPATTAQLDGDRLVFDLPQLGAGGAQALWPADPTDLPSLALESGEDGRLVVKASNGTAHEFWAWGVSGPGGTTTGRGPLVPGAEGTVSLRVGGLAFQQFPTPLADAVIQAHNLWQTDPSGRGFQDLWALSEAASWSRLDDQDELFFFAFTEQWSLPIEVGGKPIPGATLVVVPIDLESEQELAIGSARGELVGVGEAAFIDRGPGYLSAQTDEMTVRYRVPEGAGELQLNFIGGQGELPALFEAYDWQAGEYVEVGLQTDLDPNLFVSAGGEMMVRMLSRLPDDPAEPGDPNFVQRMLSPYSVVLEWQAA